MVRPIEQEFHPHTWISRRGERQAWNTFTSMNTHATCNIIYNNVAGTYMSLVGWDVLFFFGHVVPIHTRPCFDLLPPHTGDAGQLHGFPQDGFCRRGDLDTYWLAQVDCRNIERLCTFSSAVSRMKAQSKCSSFESPSSQKCVLLDVTSLGCLSVTVQEDGCADFDTTFQIHQQKGRSVWKPIRFQYATFTSVMWKPQVHKHWEWTFQWSRRQKNYSQIFLIFFLEFLTIKLNFFVDKPYQAQIIIQRRIFQ